ncbi:AAA family ATPase [Candidatus Methylospira mobilis]|uniref:ATP-binding protein n=1 Tax=Candidatus Methylospira mobilis TaxID=1808979 RepID=UPI0028F0988F|nr:AAA family ATPase [Candidatus Methylospira mobilis]WNV03020.1 AAA family ATPase [Candidatus Methylospira mobilis]
MITRLTLRNFKRIGEQAYDFTRFDLLVGRNNSGKSTVLQALAIWQFCVNEFHRSKRSGSKGIQVVLPNFTALPVPEFLLLWKDKTERRYPDKKLEYVLIGIGVEWRRATGETAAFGVQLRYHSPQTIYVIPEDGWAKFRDCEQQGDLPVIAYVPPFSGLEPEEKWLDISPIRQQVGKGQPGSVLRNLLLRVCPEPPRENGRITKNHMPPADWRELADIVERWFSVTIREPKYDSAKDVYINVEYREENGKNYDIIAGGSGFHQTLTLLGFLYGYKPTTILLDEPDAHLHVNLQREILDYFKQKSMERGTQFLIATHAEEFVRGVDACQIVSLLALEPRRLQSSPDMLRAMSDVTNEEITFLTASPCIVYVEGEDDERLLRAWAAACGAQAAVDKVFFKIMGGGTKQLMMEEAKRHFSALRQILPHKAKLMLFDYDGTDDAFHPGADNPALFEWRRKNIENYLLVPDAWKRAALKQLQSGADDLFAKIPLQIIDTFFNAENLTLPPGRNWRNVGANIFSVVDGKRLLFDNDNALFQQLKSGSPSLQLTRTDVALNMVSDEIHEDVHRFMLKLLTLAGTD